MYEKNVTKNVTNNIFLPDSDREDQAAESRTGSLVVPPKKMSSALGSLMASYGSTSESDEEPEGESATVRTNPMWICKQ